MSLLPPNATALERAFERVLESRIAAIETSYRAFWSAEDCPESDLPWLAWALSIDEWNPAWPVALRRAQVARAISVHRKKGTLGAVREVVAGLGGTISVKEWWQSDPPGDPHTFRVLVALGGDSSGAPPSAELISAVTAQIRSAKPLRSHFDLVVANNAVARVGLKAVARPATLVRVSCTSPAQIFTIPPNALTLGGVSLTLAGETIVIGA